jgi:hypothetical protein
MEVVDVPVSNTKSYGPEPFTVTGTRIRDPQRSLKWMSNPFDWPPATAAEHLVRQRRMRRKRRNGSMEDHLQANPARKPD